MTRERRKEAREAGPPVGVARIGVDNPGSFGEDQPLTAAILLRDLAAATRNFPPELDWKLTYASPTRLEFEAER